MNFTSNPSHTNHIENVDHDEVEISHHTYYIYYYIMNDTNDCERQPFWKWIMKETKTKTNNDKDFILSVMPNYNRLGLHKLYSICYTIM